MERDDDASRSVTPVRHLSLLGEQTLMVRRRASAVSNHEAPTSTGLILRDALTRSSG
jgi:hypothetical protein